MSVRVVVYVVALVLIGLIYGTKERGLFIAPPIVTASGDNFIVLDGDASWLLTADVFGATFHHMASDAPLPASSSPR